MDGAGGFPLSLSFWDLLLLVAVSTMVLVVAYLSHPRWKAFVLMLPVPFTFSTLALGARVDATNAAGLILLLLFTHLVRILHYRLRLPIVAAILLADGAYVAVATLSASWIPEGDVPFLIACGVNVVLATVALRLTPPRNEPAHRTPLPVRIKVPLTMGLVSLLIVGKSALQGFMTTFPMVGTFASYEARHSLWTNCRQIPILMVLLTPTMIAVRYLTPHVGMPLAFVGGWVVFLAGALPLGLAVRRHVAGGASQVETRPTPCTRCDG
jgi:hypothetical protein